MIQVEGGLSVKAAMLGGKRIVHTVFLDETRHDKDAHFIERKAEELSIPMQKMSRHEIDEMANGRTHGGVLAHVGERMYQTKEETIQGTPLLALVEGVEDPFNLGYIMRSLYSAGCTGLVLRNRDWSNADSTILKSSAGAFEYLNVVLSDDLSKDLAYCYGLLHDIGRYPGRTSEKHLIDGYRYCMNLGWDKAAQICISHAFMIQDIHTSIGTFDVSKEDYTFMEQFLTLP